MDKLIEIMLLTFECAIILVDLSPKFAKMLTHHCVLQAGQVLACLDARTSAMTIHHIPETQSPLGRLALHPWGKSAKDSGEDKHACQLQLLTLFNSLG